MIPHMPRPEQELASRRLRVLRPARDASASIIVSVTSRVPFGFELARCLQSVADQEMGGETVGVVLLLDGLTAAEHLDRLEIPECLGERTWILAANCGTASRARNAVLDFIDKRLADARWVARLDADDLLAGSRSLAEAVALGERAEAIAVLGGNRVLSRDGQRLRDNPASVALLDRKVLLDRLRQMAEGTAENELPSCNLLLRVRSGVRYPDTSSAEDHWLVADLLFHRGREIAILDAPLFMDYHLDGPATEDAVRSERHHKARRALHLAAMTWARVSALPGEILGLGQEGVVRCHAGMVYKHFYPNALSDEKVDWLASTLRSDGPVPAADFERDPETGAWIAHYPHEITYPFERVDPEAVRAFLTQCLEHEIVCANVKRSNFRVRQDGSLVYVDVGRWVIPMNVSYLLDAAARLHSIGVLGAPDEDLQRRATDLRSPPIWQTLEGFADAYAEIVGEWVHRAWAVAPSMRPVRLEPADDVTLLLKACAMDARDFRAQVRHIVDQLTQPRAFARRVLLIDPFRGPFLRQHAQGDLDAVFAQAERLQQEGVLDDIWVGPSDPLTVSAVNQRWFGVDTVHTHAADGVPVAPQVWAFDKIETRFVLQADLDVLIGRRELSHDYLTDMIEAARNEDVVCVAFNIPFAPGVRPYGAPPGEYKPEVRLGLLDLHRLRALRPLPAGLRNGRLDTTWYRALHEAQRQRGLKTVRGGDSATFYVHPLNDRKSDAAVLGRIRDLVAQGRVPDSQRERWDLESPDDEWTYQSRSERVVVVSLGRNTPASKIHRYAQGLACQTCQTFGVVVIDDSSEVGAPSELVRSLGWLGDRLTLIRNPVRRGRVQNYRFALSEICQDESTMVLVVDLDDALAHPQAVEDVLCARDAGHDVVWAAPFRPDAPTRVYQPEPDKILESYGGDVWIHLRAFRKGLFDGLAPSHLELDGQPLETLVDYAMMMPIAAHAQSPLFLPRYRYWHERTTMLDADGERQRDQQILRLLAKSASGEG